MRRALFFTAVVLSTLLIALPSLASEPSATYLDKFSSQGFGGNDGTLDFSGPWVEIGESNGPTSGYVWVWDHEYCDGEFCLKMGGDDEAEGRGAYRAVDLTGATSATLRLDYGRALLDDESDGTAAIQVSPDGGDTWITLKTISLDEDDDKLKKNKKFSISDWATADTRVRFIILDADDLEAYWLIDNVTVEAKFEEATTTTTTTQPPTTTTTTTTKPPATTTTTKPVSTTITTTTTSVPRTTTTVPRTTTTTAPPVLSDDNLSPEDREMMVNKSGLAITAAMPGIAVPSSTVEGSSQSRPHAEPVEAFAAAFFTDSGDYGGNLLPSVVLGIVIAVLILFGIGSRTED